MTHDVCIAGNSARNGICGAADCVCAPRPAGLSCAHYQALKNFASNEGRCWKSALRHCWETGIYPNGCRSDLLQQVRNIYGPSWLVKFTFKTWKDYGVHNG